MKRYQLLPCDFWGDETGHVLTGHAWCWVIDPNDGTSDFLKGRKGSAISVGLLLDTLPVLGVMHAPVTPDRGAYCIAWAEGLPDLLRNGQPISYRTESEMAVVSNRCFGGALQTCQDLLRRDWVRVLGSGG